MMTSNMVLYSLGKVITDIKEDSLYVDVFPYEKVPNYSGDINLAKTSNLTNTNIDGVKDNEVVTKSVSIKAKWINLGSNRITPPMVCKGETVLLFRYSNTDKFYWIPMYNEQMIRKNEKATWVFSNRPNINPKGDKLSKCYYYTIDTINKLVTLHTDDSNGEYTTYDININTKKGVYTTIDGHGNYAKLISNKDTYTVYTHNIINTISDNTINRQTKTLNEYNTVTNITTGDSKTESITNGYNLTLGNMNMTAKADVIYTIGGNYNITAGPIAVATPSLNIVSGTTSMSSSGGGMEINVDTMSIKNTNGELFELLTEIAQGVIDFKGIDGDGETVTTDDSTVSTFTTIKNKLASFIS